MKSWPMSRVVAAGARPAPPAQSVLQAVEPKIAKRVHAGDTSCYGAGSQVPGDTQDDVAHAECERRRREIGTSPRHQ